MRLVDNELNMLNHHPLWNVSPHRPKRPNLCPPRAASQCHKMLYIFLYANEVSSSLRELAQRRTAHICARLQGRSQCNQRRCDGVAYSAGGSQHRKLNSLLHRTHTLPPSLCLCLSLLSTPNHTTDVVGALLWEVGGSMGGIRPAK